MLSAKEQLQAVYDLLKDPEHWTKGAYARNKDDERVPYDSSSAVCWCLEGALYKVGGDYLKARQAYAALERVTLEWHGDGIVHLNDASTHAMVLSCIKGALEIVDEIH